MTFLVIARCIPGIIWYIITLSFFLKRFLLFLPYLTQAFLDIIFAYYRAHDPDSGVTSYEVAWGTAPGKIDVWDYEEVGNTTIWFAKVKVSMCTQNYTTD